MRYRPEIDGLRAVAVVPVILFHAGLPLFSGGFVGVDIFFVISGYLITRIMIDDLKQNRFHILSFYARRARRILPALFFVLAAYLPVAWVWLPPLDREYFFDSLAAVAVFSSNFFFWNTSGYFDTAAELKPLLHTWSLAVEEQYYVIFPLFLMLAWRFFRRRLALLFSAICVASLIAAQWASGSSPAAAFYLLPTRMWELLVGALIAIHLSSGPTDRFGRRISGIGGWIGAALIFYSIFRFNSQTPFPGVYALAPTVGAALIITFASAETTVGRLLRNKAAVSIGMVSYSAYLWHQPVFAFARIRTGKTLDGALTLALLLTTCSLAYFTWRYIEKPWRGKNTAKVGGVLAMALSGSMIFLGLGLLGGVDYVRPNELSIKPLMATRPDPLQRTNECFLLTAGAEDLDEANCIEDTDRTQYHLLLLGDSHAASLYPGLLRTIGEKGIRVSMLSAALCLPLVERFPNNASLTATERCSSINQKIMRIVERNHFDMIIVSSYILQWGFRQDWNWTYPGYYQDFMNKLAELAARTRVLVVGQFLTWPDGLPNIVAGEAKLGGYRRLLEIPDYSSFGIDKQLFIADRKLKKDLEGSGVEYRSLVDILCKGDVCLRFVPDNNGGRKLISFDYGHLGLEASDYLSEHILETWIMPILQPGHGG